MDSSRILPNSHSPILYYGKSTLEEAYGVDNKIIDKSVTGDNQVD